MTTQTALPTPLLTDSDLRDLLGSEVVNRSARAHAIRMSMPEFRGRAWTPEAIHYLAEREHHIDLTVYAREIDFRGRLSDLRALHQIPCPAPSHFSPSDDSHNTKLITLADCGWCGEPVVVR